jgi:hypothetical protein
LGRVTPCPICGQVGGFHDSGAHAERLVPTELVYRKHHVDGRDGVWMRADGSLLPHLREGAAGERADPYYG